MFCTSCKKYQAPEGALAPAFCAVCGSATTEPAKGQIASDLTYLRYLMNELSSWSDAGLIDEVLRARLVAPYQQEAAAAALYGNGYSPQAVRPVSPWCHQDRDLAGRFCPSCGENLEAWKARLTDDVAKALDDEWQAPARGSIPEIVAVAQTATADVEPTATSRGVPEERPLEARLSWFHSAEDGAPGVAAQAAQAPAAEVPVPAADLPARTPGRLVQEIRPVFYENLILFLGAFLVFAGSIYFAIYFWDRLGSLGPLVAGSLLAVYALSFAGTGYLLQRRYHAELSSRVLYGIATAILPVASTVVGAPTGDGGLGVTLLAACAVGLWSAAAYPAILVASSLFQREIGKPFARAFVALLLIIGLAPLVLRVGPRPLGVAYLYLAAIPLLAMYRQVRDVGRVFEKDTVIYIVGGSAYLFVAVAARVALVLSPTLTLPELAPLVILMATAAIDLDVEWRERSRAVRSTLGVVGVLAHAAGVLAVVMAFEHPLWRVLTTLGAGLLFGVTALRHRRAYALHLALLAVAAGALMVPWLPSIAPPRWVAMGGLLLLPLTLGLARLGARWRRHAAVEFAVPAELWTVLCPVAACLLALLLPLLGTDWRPRQLGAWGGYLASLVVLPASAATMSLAWTWSRRRIHLTISALAACSTALVIARAVGAEGLGLGSTAAGLTLVVAGAAAIASSKGAEETGRALRDAALALLAATAVILLVTRIGPWHQASTMPSVLTFVLAACAAVAVAAGQPRREVGVVAVLSATAAAAAGLWTTVPHDLLAGILGLSLLVLDRTKSQVTIGKAQPFRDAYVVALAALLLQITHILGHVPAPELLPPLEPALVGVALLVIAARHQSPWPTYGAFGFFLATAYGVPAALDLAVRPLVFAKGVGLALIFLALGCRLLPRLRPWRETFLDIPLHLAAVVAPFSLLRFFWTFGLWVAEGGAETHLLLRRVASPLVLAALVAITHGSRLHAYLGAAALVFVGPAVAASLGLGDQAVAPALAAMTIVIWVVVHEVSRRPFFAQPVEKGDRPLPLFELWFLPSAETIRDLWVRPLGLVTMLAALASFGISLLWSVEHWPTGSSASAVVFGLVATYSVLRWWRPTDVDRKPSRSLPAHAVCAAIAALSIEGVHLAGYHPDAGGLLALGLGYMVLSEALAVTHHPGAPAGVRASSLWAILALLVPLTLQIHLTHLTTPLCAALLVVAVVRFGHRHRVPGIKTASSVSSMAAASFLVLWLLGQASWLRPEGIALALLGLASAAGGWVHWVGQRRLRLKDSEAIRFASGWSVVGCALAQASTYFPDPASAPGFLGTSLGILTLALATTWFMFAAIRTGKDRFGFTALAGLLFLYVSVRLSPIGSGWSSELDAIVAIGFAFALHFLSEVLRRTSLTALERPAAFGARFLPLGACIVVAWDAIAGHGSMPTLQHALMAETIGVLYMLGFMRGGHRVLGLVAMCFYNLGLILLCIHTGRHDALYYTIPVGASIVLLARIYRTNLSPSARRGLRTAGCLLIYFSTYFRVVQFDSGVYPLILGAATLVGIVLGFFLQLRDLFLLSAGFLVLNVVSNLTYYGVHRPVLGWTLLTLVGLCLTASGILFQMRRAQVRAFVARVRTTLAGWD